MTAAELGVLVASFLASAVELVEALTIVLAMGLARDWRSSLAGAGAAAVALAVAVAVFGTAVHGAISESALQLTVGTLLLVFGLQWLRKAILRSAGLLSLHDEEATFAAEREAAGAAPRSRRLGLDAYAFVVSFKGVLLEGLEVVFIVITFGATAHDVPLAAAGAGAAAVIVIGAGVAIHQPLARVPENTLKYVVGLLLTTFGTFWMVEGTSVFASSGESVRWPGGEGALLLLLAAWVLASQILIRVLRRPPARRAEATA